MKRILPLFALVLTVVVTRPLAGQSQSPGPEYVPGEVLVEFEPDATAELRADARSWVRGERRELLKRRRNGAGDLELTRLQGGSVEQAIAMLRRHPAVRYAEPNWIYRTLETSDDPRYLNGSMWGMYGDTGVAPLVNQFGSQANEAWAEGNTGSHSVAIGVIDEGIQITHPDLVANIWTNPAEAAGVAGVDDDDNGYIDDLHGWDFRNNDNNGYDGLGDDHGTHVAGTIGAKGGNGVGVAGVNWNVTLVPAKFLQGTGSTAHAIAAIDYLIDLKIRHGLNIVATSNSWGGGGFSQALLDAIVRGAQANILFVAAAGNSNANNDTTPFYPANYNTTAGAGYDAVISVASITSTGAKSSFSSYGTVNVDLGAPGSSIWSTVPSNTYANYDGTSMATPHVSGAAALYASLLPSVSARRIKEVILATATPTPSLAGKTVTGGRLNIGEFAAAPPPAPGAPVDLVATTISSGQIDLTWHHPGTDEDGFQIERCADAACSDFALLASIDAGLSGYSDHGLSSSTLYRYRVSAFNRGGSASNVAQAITLDPPLLVASAGANFSVDEGQAASLDGTLSSDPEDDPLTFAWVQLDGPSVVLAGADSSQPTFMAPAVANGGETLTFELTVTANGDTASDTVTVTVLNVNAAPMITSAAPPAATEDEAYVYAATMSDEDGPGQQWGIVSDDHTCGGEIDPASGMFSFTPEGPIPPASCVLSIQVCDGGQPNGCATETATVTIAAVNDAPAITSAAPSTATEDVAFAYAATAADGDSASLTWSLLPAHTCGGTIDPASGVFGFTPAGPAPPATCVAALQVCDDAAPNACASEMTTVAIAAVNDGPVITSVAPATATEDTPYAYGAIADDGDGPGQSWSLLPAHSCGGTLDSASGVFSFTPTGPAPPASCVVALEVCDGAAPNACASETATVTIAATNDAPAITSAAPSSATEDVAYSYAATSSDGDGPGQTWSLLPAHSCGGTIDADGLLTFTPAGPTPAASCTLAIQMCDGGEPNACATETVTVTIAAVNDAPVITTAAPVMATEDVAYTYAAASTDADGPGATWSVLPAHTCGGTINGGGAFTFTPAGPTPPASCVVALQVCDDAEPNACATQAATVTIAAVNDVPAFAAPANITAPASSASGVTVSFAATGSDPEDGSLAAACTPVSGSVFPIGDTTVSCTVTDSAGATAGGSFMVTVLDAKVPGEMRGDGFIRDDQARYQFTFFARERASGSERARLSVRIDEHGKTKGKKRDDRFESRSVDFMMFSDDPSILPGRPGRPQIDTVLFSGAGEWNGHGGYRYEVSAQDGGEPGRHRESIRVTIRDSAGAVVASFEGDLDGGNVQSSRLRH